MFKVISLRICFLVCLLALLLPQPAGAQDETPLVLVLTVDGPVSSAMVEYLSRGIETAEQRGAEVLIFQLSTPGGSVDLMETMVKDIRASQVPVVVYVAPRGAIAGSAGAVITMAGHVAAMAPETAIGAASPVGSQGEDLGETLETKAKEALKASARSLVERRGSAAVTLAEAMIETAEAASASEALEAGLIDFIASNLDELIQQLEGFPVELESDSRLLNTVGAEVVTIDQTFIEQLLQVLTNPNIVFLLLSIGVQAILIEISSPGGWVAGFIGVVCLALASFGLGVLDVNWFGIVFLITAFVLFILDIKAPTHGALTAAAVGSLIVGALVLFNSPGTPSFQRVSVPLVLGVSLFSGALFLAILTLALRAQSFPVLMGQEGMLGQTGLTRNELSTTGIVQVAGEKWMAELAPGEEPLARGDRFKVVDTKGLRLLIRKVKKTPEDLAN